MDSTDIAKQIDIGFQKAGKVYGYDESHDPTRPAQRWFQQSPEGEVLFIVFYSQACRFVSFYFALLMLAGVSGCATAPHPDDLWFAEDKAKHFIAAGAIAAGATLAADGAGVNRRAAPGVGFTVAMGFGAGKELYDQNIKKTYWSWKDFTWDAIGGVVGSLCASGFQSK